MNTKLKPKMEIDDDDFTVSMGKEPLGFTTKSQVICNYSVHIFDDIKDASHYSKVFDLCMDAVENDLIDFFISSNGGDLDGLNILLEGIRLTDATVRAIVVGACHSAASILALNCHDIVITNSATSLIHNIRTGFGGKIADLENFTNFTRKISNKLIKDTYSGFLSDLELNEVLHGKELWIEADEFRERLAKRQEYFQLQEQALQEPPPVAPKRRTKAPKE